MRSFHIATKQHRGRFNAVRISRGFLSLILLFAVSPWRTTPGQQARPGVTPEQSPAHVGGAQGGRNTSGQEQREATGEIKGRVVDVEGRPLPNASVVGRAVGSPRDLKMSVTDAEGNFELKGLTPAAYLVNAFSRGYVMEKRTALQPADYTRPGDSLTIRMVKGGVITGQVSDASGKPLVAARVHVLRVRDEQGQPLRLDTPKRFAPTDDRGVYRHYGLEPGTYLVSVGGSGDFNLSPATSGDEPPSYYPASTRSAAAEVVVSEGQEVSGINIQQRSQRGYAVSGHLSGALKAGGAGNITVALINASNGATEAMLSITGDARGFAFYAVPEGEYQLTAQSNLGTTEAAMAAARRVSVKGKDAAPVELTLQPLGSISGRVTLEPSSSTNPVIPCAGRRGSRVEESVIQVRLSGAGSVAEPLPSTFTPTGGAMPDATGAFILRDLPAGRYFLKLDLPDEDWFVRAVTASGVATNEAQAIDASRNGLTLTPGARLEGLTVSLGVGAASLHGRVTAIPVGASTSSARVRVYLLPAEREQAANALRYTAAPLQSDGTFSFTNLAPGSYRLVARVIADELSSSDVQMLFADPDTRARLLGEAEAANHRVALQACQRVSEFTLPLTPPADGKTNH